MPNNQRRLTRVELESLMAQIFVLVDCAGSTKEELREVVDQVSKLTDPDTTIEQDGNGEWQVMSDEADDGDESDEDDDDEADEA